MEGYGKEQEVANGQMIKPGDIERPTYGKRIVLPKGSGYGCVHPEALYLEGEFRLYYTPYPPDEAELPFLAVSRDGRTFHGVKDNPLIRRGGGWESHHLADIDVIHDGDRWMMYYVGARYTNGRKESAIGLAISEDGIKWKKYDANPIMVPDEKFWWEKGTSGRKSVNCPTAIKIKNRYFLYYSSVGKDGVSRIALAISDNGIDFKRVGIAIQPEFRWEGKGVDHPDVVRWGDTLVITYVGVDGEGSRHLGLAFASVSEPARVVKRPEPLISPRDTLLKKLTPLGGRVMNFISLLFRGSVKYVFSRLTSRNVYGTPLWNALWIYRASFLSDPAHNLVKFHDRALLYYSAYDLLLKIPSIGVTEVKIPQNVA